MNPTLVNGVHAADAVGATIAELLRLRGIDHRGVAVARNGEVVPASVWVDVTVEAGDAIEIVGAAAGG